MIMFKRSVYRHWLKLPKSKNELMAVEFAEMSGIKVRPKRNIKNLPNAWDDIPVHIDNSWKTNTKNRKQWDSYKKLKRK